MSAFGKRGGVGGGGRPSFGVAKPMKGGPGAAAVQPSSPPEGGDQFPPIDELTPPVDAPMADSGAPLGAMDRLTVTPGHPQLPVCHHPVNCDQMFSLAALVLHRSG